MLSARQGLEETRAVYSLREGLHQNSGGPLTSAFQASEPGDNSSIAYQPLGCGTLLYQPEGAGMSLESIPKMTVPRKEVKGDHLTQAGESYPDDQGLMRALRLNDRALRGAWKGGWA